MTDVKTLDRLSSPRLAELASVFAVRDIQNKDPFVPRGAEGTVVLVHGNCEAYEVEFTQPVHAIICVDPGDIAPR